MIMGAYLKEKEPKTQEHSWTPYIAHGFAQAW